MQNKSLLFGISGFILGGLVVAIAATTFDKPSNTQTSNSNMSSMTMSEMTSSLQGKSGDDYDKAFI